MSVQTLTKLVDGLHPSDGYSAVTVETVGSDKTVSDLRLVHKVGELNTITAYGDSQAAGVSLYRAVTDATTGRAKVERAAALAEAVAAFLNAGGTGQELAELLEPVYAYTEEITPLLPATLVLCAANRTDGMSEFVFKDQDGCGLVWAVDRFFDVLTPTQLEETLLY